MPQDALPARKRIALVAHDNMKKDLLEWALFNKGSLSKHELCATGTTGALGGEGPGRQGAQAPERAPGR